MGKFIAEGDSFITLAKGNRFIYIHTYIHACIQYIQFSQNPPFINLFQYRHARLVKDSTSDPLEV